MPLTYFTKYLPSLLRPAPPNVKVRLKGADVKTRDKGGMTALAHAEKVKARVSSDKARSRDVDEYITLLKKSGAK